MTPSICVIMPAYNAEKTLKKAIESVQSQTFKNWELIIVDDCSKDKTVELATTIALTDSRIKVIQLDKNTGGAYQPRLRGIASTDAEWIVALDADDWLENEFIEKLLIRQRETNAEIVLSNIVSPTTGIVRVPKVRVNPSAVCIGKEWLQHTLFSWQISMNGALMKRRLWETASNYEINPSNLHADETLFRLILLHAGITCMTPAKYYYYENPESVTRCGSIRKLENIAMNNFMKNVIDKNFPPKSTERCLIKKQCESDMVCSLMYMVKNKFSQSDKDYGLAIMQNNIGMLDWRGSDYFPLTYRLLLLSFKLIGVKKTYNLVNFACKKLKVVNL